MGFREAAARLVPWGDAQFRNGSYLMLNSIVGAVAGLAFWVVLVRFYVLPDRDIGIGLAIISLCTALGLLAKGGLDTALVRHVPRASREDALGLLRFACLVAFGVVVALVVLLGLLGPLLGGSFAGLDAPALVLVAALSGALAVTWLQDAQFLAAGEARLSFYRNLALHSGRLAAPAFIVGLAVPYPIPAAWGVALVLSALLAHAFVRRMAFAPPEAATPVRRKAFLRSAGRNVTGSAAEFLPGLLLPPLVLHLEGAEAAAYFGIAFTGASVLFLLSAAIGRSAFAEMSRTGQTALQLRRAVKHHLLVVAPAALVAVALAPEILGYFGWTYAAHGSGVFLLLAASIVFVAPVYLYLALLRSREERGMLLLYPAVNIAALFALAPVLEAQMGTIGIAVAWLLVHAPLGAFAAWKIRAAVREVNDVEPPAAQAVGGHPHVE